MRKNIHPAVLATLAFTLALFCGASTRAQERQDAARSARAGDELATVESNAARLEPAGRPAHAAPAKGARAPRSENLGAAVLRLTGLRLFVNALRSESGKNSTGAPPSAFGGGALHARPANTPGGNFIMPHPNERRSNSEPYRPHN